MAATAPPPRGHAPRASTSSQTQSLAVSFGDLAALVSLPSSPPSSSTAVALLHPTDDAVLSVLLSRFRSDLVYTYAGTTTMAVVNPFKELANENDASRREYEERCFKDTSLQLGSGGVVSGGLQPHPYDMAAKIYLLMRRTGENQAVITEGIAGSGKSYTAHLLLTQLLHLSSPSLLKPATSSKRPPQLPSLILSLSTLLSSFTHAKTGHSPSASHLPNLLALHFSPSSGRLLSSRLLAFGLHKSRLSAPLARDERTFHVFYQLLAGASGTEREEWMLEDDAAAYATLASSGCFRLPAAAGHIADDSAAFGQLREAMSALGFKARHQASIFKLLAALLLLGNAQFGSPDHIDVPSPVLNPVVLAACARLLGVDAEEFAERMTARTGYVKGEVYEIFLGPEGARKQRDGLVRDLYAILVKFLVEGVNRRFEAAAAKEIEREQERKAKEAPSDPSLPEFATISILDLPGFISNTPLPTSLSVSASNNGYPLIATQEHGSFDDFCANFCAELVHNFVLRSVFGEEGWAASLRADGINVGLGIGSALDSELAASDATVELLKGPSLPAHTQGRERQAVQDKIRRPGGIIGFMGAAVEKYYYAPRSTRSAGGRSGERDSQSAEEDEQLVRDLVQRSGVHAGAGAGLLPSSSLSSVAPGSPFPSPSPAASPDRTTFTISHHLSGTSSCAYSARSFVTSNADLLDPGFVGLLRESKDAFVRRLLSGPGMGVEQHEREEGVVVRCQVGAGTMRAVGEVLTPVLNGAESDGEKKERGDDDDFLDFDGIYPVTTHLNAALASLTGHLSRPAALGGGPARLWTIACIRPNDSLSPASLDRRRARPQLRALHLSALSAHRAPAELVVGLDHEKFCARYVGRMRGSVEERVRQCAAANGWGPGESPWSGKGGESEGGREYRVGREKVWLSYMAWKSVEDVVREGEKEGRRAALAAMGIPGPGEDDEERDSVSREHSHSHDDEATDFGYPPGVSSGLQYEGSNDNLLLRRVGTNGTQYRDPNTVSAAAIAAATAAGRSRVTSYDMGGLSTPYSAGAREWDAEYDPDDKRALSPGASPAFDSKEEVMAAKDNNLIVNDAPNTLEEMPTSGVRRTWLWVVRGLTFWIPDFMLRFVGRMDRPDVRLAWREKVAICFLIFLLNGLIIFYIVEFGRLLCPDYDKAWASNEVAEHTGNNDWWVSIQGKVYDMSSFIQGDHSDIPGEASNGEDTLDILAGQDLTYYFPPPLNLACAGLVNSESLQLTYKNFTPEVPTGVHLSGPLQGAQKTKLDDDNWYPDTFLPFMKQYYKGTLVWKMSDIEGQAQDQTSQRIWAVYENSVYDLTDYVNTVQLNQDATSLYNFLDEGVASVFQDQAGQDVTNQLNEALDKLDPATRSANMDCLNNQFYVGEKDFRNSARCQVQNYMLLVFSSIIMASMGLKFLSALQLTGKRNPEMLDKFVLCQVPCYTEGEDSLRRTIDSLAALNYDDKRKLIFIICDGNIIGSGNDRTTPRIVLDILGVDPKLDPEPLMFKSIGEGSKQMNYGKVYSGLYEFEGHVVPYMVVVKIGKPTERSKPGNRGKRDSQILLMRYLNRVHFDSPMFPLELEIYHQMRNVIGIDPAFYEYIFTVDADTSVSADSLNRLVASAADDSSVIGICGETKLENEEGSWWTMIQVYEYYISHHLSKAFESLFGSVTCLPGCFSLYRIRTADKGRPVIISNRIIDDYAENHVDTLHKKNLFSLGEDRYLTTLLLKHFPTFRTKFIPDAVARTVAPESWRVLFSQRRRWINSTVHNLCELVFLPELIGFCCFSMRFFVFIDLLSTLILPATVVYLLYLIITVSTGHAAFPLISIIMIAATYGFQAIIFLLKREFMLVGWMVVYLLSYPVYSFFLPVYSFWCMDEFSWGNTRVVVGEGNNKRVMVSDDEKFDDSMIPLKKFSEYEAEAWETSSRHTVDTYKTGNSSKPRSRLGPPSHEGSHRSFHQASQADDYYRNTNFTYNNSSNPNLRLPNRPSHQNMASQYGTPQQTMSQYGGAPQLPLMPFANGSVRGSEYGGPMPGVMPAIGYQNAGSIYGMTGAPRNTMMTNLNMFGGDAGSQAGGFLGTPGMPRPMSTFSVATTANPFSTPSMNPNPSDEELFTALRSYLSTQDLMTVTKKTAREAMAARFPQADLTSRKDFINQSIDKILSES